MKKNEVIIRNSPLNFVDTKTVFCRFGQSILDIYNEHLAVEGVKFTASLNGAPVPQDEWALTFPRTEDQVIFTPWAGDGDVLGIVATIAVVVVATVLAPELAPYIGQVLSDVGLTGLAMSSVGIATGALMVAGGLITNALLPHPAAKIPTLDSISSLGGISSTDITKSQSYGWNPQTTQQQGTVKPRHYGRNKLYGNIIAWNREYVGDKSYINVLICLGIGPYKELWDFKINDQPISSFPCVEVHTRLGHVNQTPIPNFNDTKIEYPQSIQVRNGSPYTYVTIGDSFDGLEIDVTFPRGLWHQNEQTGNFDSYGVNMSIEIRRQGESTWHCITQSSEQREHPIYEYVNEWWIGRWETYSGQKLFMNVNYGWSSDPNAHSEGQPVNAYWHRSEGGWWYVVTSEVLNMAGEPSIIIMPFDNNPYSHYEGEPYNGLIWHWKGYEHVKSWYDTITYDYVTIRDNRTSSITRTFKVDGLAKGKYEIRVTNLTPYQGTVRYGEEMYFSAIREVLYDDFEYPRHVLVGIKGLASEQLNGNLRFSCMGDCAMIRVWDGSRWYVDASDNPAWVKYDILTRPVFDNSFNVIRYDGRNPSNIDLVKWKESADFNNTLVPDGKGGYEKRITFNGLFDYMCNVWAAVMRISELDRATPIHNGLKLTLAIDKPQTPKQLFCVGNIERGSFKRQWLSTVERASEFVAVFANQEKDYKRDELAAYNENINTSNTINLDLFGETRPSGVWRCLRYKLNNNQYLLESAQFAVFTESLVSILGDVVNVAHDVPRIGFSGRLVSATANSVTLDRDVTIEAGKTYQVMVKLTFGHIVAVGGQNYICKDPHIADANNKPGTGAAWQSYWDTTDEVGEAWVSGKDYYSPGSHILSTVTNAPGTYSTLNLASAYSKIPAKFDNYSFGEANKVVKPFRIIDMQPSMNFKCVLSLVEYNETIYNSDLLQPVLPTPSYQTINILPSVKNVRLDEILVKGPDGTLVDNIDVYFDRPNDSMFQKAEIWFANGGGWKYEGESLGYHRIRNVEVGKTYTVAVVAVNPLGQKQSIVQAPQVSIYTKGKLDRPSDVTGFTAKQNGQYVDFNWNHIPDGDLWGYRIYQGTSIASGREIVDLVTANSHSWQAELNGTYRFLITAIDDSGLESITPASVDITLKGIDENLNVIFSQDEISKPGGPDGTKTNMVFVPDASPYMTMPHMLTFAAAPDWTFQSPEITNYTGDINTTAEYVSNAIDTLKVGNTWTRILTTIAAVDPGATFQSYSERTFSEFPTDTFQHITMPVDLKVYLSCSNDGLAYTPWEQYFGTVQKEFRYVKVKLSVSITSQSGTLLSG
ncbi:MAG: hypothetical protein M1510_10675 [Nitrospirae bacterium]|nr:hypothetical protein [Nitrospirota bacterium]